MKTAIEKGKAFTHKAFPLLSKNALFRFLIPFTVSMISGSILVTGALKPAPVKDHGRHGGHHILCAEKHRFSRVVS